MAGLGINLGYLLVQIFNFLIIATVIYLLILKPIVNLLNKRRAAVAQGWKMPAWRLKRAPTLRRKRRR